MNDPIPRDPIGAINEDAAEFYRAQHLAPAHSDPGDYASGRGFSALLGDTEWTLDYTLDSWTALRHHLIKVGYSVDTIRSQPD